MRLPRTLRAVTPEAYALLSIYRAVPKKTAHVVWLRQRFRQCCREANIASAEKAERNKELDVTLTLLTLLQLQRRDETVRFWAYTRANGMESWVRLAVIRTAAFLNL